MCEGQEEVAAEEEMATLAELPPAGHHGEGEHQENHHITELLEQERQLHEPVSSSSGKPAEDTGDTGLVNRYKELAHGELDIVTALDSATASASASASVSASDNGSAHALPRRVASPVDSTVSIPDDTPSVQVYCPKLPRREAHADLARDPYSPPPAAAFSHHSLRGPD